MLKLVCAVAIILSYVSFSYGQNDKNAQILKQDSDVQPDGGYSWSFETDNGIKAQEQGSHQATGEEEGIMSVQGGSSYRSPEGETVEISYIADENGFQPQGSHIPTPPPIPPAIQRSLEYNAAHPESENQPQRG